MWRLRFAYLSGESLSGSLRKARSVVKSAQAEMEKEERREYLLSGLRGGKRNPPQVVQPLPSEGKFYEQEKIQAVSRRGEMLQVRQET